MDCRRLLVPLGFRSVEKKNSAAAANLELFLIRSTQLVYYSVAFDQRSTCLVWWRYGLHRPVLPERKNGSHGYISQVTS